MTFVHYNGKIVNTTIIEWIDYHNLAKMGYIRVYCKDSVGEVVEGPEAFNIVMLLCPDALEGHDAKYHRHAWAIHNLIGHPLMQLLSWLRLSSLAIKVHDATVPNPKIING
jgi:hypothetical protein